MFKTLLTGMIGGILGCTLVCNVINPYFPSATAQPLMEIEGCVRHRTSAHTNTTSTVLDCNPEQQ